MAFTVVMADFRESTLASANVRKNPSRLGLRT